MGKREVIGGGHGGVHSSSKIGVVDIISSRPGRVHGDDHLIRIHGKVSSRTGSSWMSAGIIYEELWERIFRGSTGLKRIYLG